MVEILPFIFSIKTSPPLPSKSHKLKHISFVKISPIKNFTEVAAIKNSEKQRNDVIFSNNNVVFLSEGRNERTIKVESENTSLILRISVEVEEPFHDSL